MIAREATQKVERYYIILVEDTGSEGTECSSEASLTATNWPPGRAADSHLFRNCRATNSDHNIYYVKLDKKKSAEKTRSRGPEYYIYI